MGCDFYIFYKVCIQYKSGDAILLKEHVLEDTRERCEWWHCERDKESEELIDYYERRELERMEQVDYELEEYPWVDLYADDSWYCDDEEQEKYINIAKKYDIKESAIMSIWKEGDWLIRVRS
jgi:hypothetical protein